MPSLEEQIAFIVTHTPTAKTEPSLPMCIAIGASLRRLALLEKVKDCANAVLANAKLGADGGCAIDELGDALAALGDRP